MKRRAIRILAAAAVVAIAAGCASTNVSTIPYPNVPVFAPGDPAKVQILRAEPARPHVKLGEIMVDVTSSPAPTPGEVDGLLRTAAAKLGADAAVIVADPRQPAGAVAGGGWWGRTPGASATREVIAVAVKYR